MFQHKHSWFNKIACTRSDNLEIDELLSSAVIAKLSWFEKIACTHRYIFRVLRNTNSHVLINKQSWFNKIT